ncbi:Secretion protein HlyD [Rhodopirellula maiorica SM1]|uniref:Secretion protein HlyD n=1 Tax=Rhodopirellula maiorica SM1 TaxID=1265738 RepID=M5R9C6_9BACT|nr:efflux RND transporter periplasmic adaptor subunit [Rhodopirellula maiorica]EMI16098.1 Secretion protein HlyD [Rhodopirellula maiorica SM1]
MLPLFLGISQRMASFASLAVLLSSSVAVAQVPVRVEPVQRQHVQQRHAVTGSLRPVARGNVAAIEAGQLRELGPREGDSIRKGDVLARVDARRLEAQHAEAVAEKAVATADLASANARLKQARADLARGQKLIHQNAIGQQELDAFEAAYEIAQATIASTNSRIDRIEQSIRLIQVRIEDTVIRAPYDASVVRRHVEPGDWVQAGDALLTIVSTGPIEAWLEVPERFVKAIDQFGASVSVRARATNEESNVLSTRRVAEVNPRVRTLGFVVTLDNADGLLSAGMSVDGWIATTGKIETETIHKDAVNRGGGQPFVYRVAKDSEASKAERVPIEILFELPERVAIRSSQLQVGDRVIVEGNERLLPGQNVTVIESPSDRDGIVRTEHK